MTLLFNLSINLSKLYLCQQRLVLSLYQYCYGILINIIINIIIIGIIYICNGSFNLSSFILSIFISMFISSICYKLFTFIDMLSFNILSQYKSMLPSLSSVLNRIPEPLFILVYIYMIFIFIIRSFFLKERPGIFYFIGLVIIINLVYPDRFFPFISFGSYVLFNLAFGLYLINLDRLGSAFSDVLINHSLTPFSQGFMAFRNKLYHSSHVIVRYVGTRSYMGIVFGKTPMSSTGRASLVICVISGTGYLINEQLNRRSNERIADAQVASQERIATANRESTERTAMAQVAAQHETNTIQRERLEYEKARDAKSSWGWK
jgi:hypothetical protein